MANTVTREDITPELLQKALRSGIAKSLSLPGMRRNLVMIEYLVFDITTAEIVAERRGEGTWVCRPPDIWADKLEELYLANFG